MTTAAQRLAALQHEHGRAMRAAEALALDLIRDLPAAQAALNTPRPTHSRTAAHDVDCLEAAVAAVWEASRADETLRPVARAARAALAEALQHRRALATSAEEAASQEVRKLCSHEPHLYEDYLQDARIGLLDAAKRFDPDRGIRFNTYARWWMRAALTRSTSREDTLRLSWSVAEQLRLARRLRDRYKLTEPEIAAELRMEVPRLREILQATPESWSLSVAVTTGPDATRTLEEVLADESCPSEADLVADLDEARRVEALKRALNELPDRERYVIVRRFGLDGREPVTLADLGRVFHVSRERIRQIERQSLWLLTDALRPESGRSESAATRVLRAIRICGPMTLPQIMTQLHLRRELAYAVLITLQARGVVVRVEKGTYAATEPAPAQLAGAA